MSVFKKNPKKTLLGVWLFVLIFLEVILRVTNPEILVFSKNVRSLYQSHPQWKVDYRPQQSEHLKLTSFHGVPIFDFSVNVGEYGFRVPTRELDEKVFPSDKMKFVHAIGDSFTQGWGVNYEESYPSILHRSLDHETVVLNLGLNGYGARAATEKSMLLWEKFPADYAVYLYTANDIADDFDATLRSSFMKEYGMPFLDSLRRNLYVANIPFSIKALMYWKASLFAEDDTYRKGKTIFDRHEGARVIDDPSSLNVKESSFVENEKANYSFQFVKTYHEFLKQKNVQLLAIIHEASETQTSMANDLFHKFCEENQIPYIRVFVPDSHRLALDGHFNYLGNRFVAQTVQKHFDLGPL